MEVACSRGTSHVQALLFVMAVPLFNVIYGGILLPPTFKINYVNVQHNYVNMRLIYVDMQHKYDDIHVINFCQKFFFLRVNFLTYAII